MKKLLILLFVIFCFSLCTHADIMPFYQNSIPHTGIGVVNFGEFNKIYEKPNVNSNIIATVSYEINGVNFNGTWYQVNRIFVAWSPRARLAYTVVIDENDNNWYNICYDQINNKTGWIQVDDRKEFFTWKEFYEYYGRKRGIYAFRDIPKQYKTLYSQPDEKAQALQSFDFARHIYLKKVTGNWVLVTLEDLHNMTKIGWVRWRSSEGKLYYFPSIQETF